MKSKKEIYKEKINKILTEIASLYDMAYESGYEDGLRELDGGDVIEHHPQEEIVEEEKDKKKVEIELKILESKIDFLEKDVERLYLNSTWVIDKLREKGIVTIKDIAKKE